MAKPVPLRQAAAELGRSEATVRRWVAEGAPTARLGQVGRGHGALVVVDHLQAWRAAQRDPGPVSGVSLSDLQRFLDDFHRARDHVYAGMSDTTARAYLDALLEYVTGRLTP